MFIYSFVTGYGDGDLNRDTLPTLCHNGLVVPQANVKALLSIIGNESGRSLLKCLSRGIMKKLCSLETIFMTVVWDSILKFYVVNKQL